MMKLTRRTNVLFSEADYLALKALSKSQGKSMGQVVRDIVRKVVLTQKKYNKKRVGLFKEIENLTQGMDFKGMDYKKLVEDGRKY